MRIIRNASGTFRGAGPAGLSCAFYLAEKGYKPVVFEKNERPGGMLTYGIPSFKLQKDVIEAEVEVIRLMGAEFRYGVEVGRDVTLAELREQAARPGTPETPPTRCDPPSLR